jgi:hypothetical protein
MAKKFMYVCLGILALTVAFHLGASSAISQGTGLVVGIAATERGDPKVFAITDGGDCYYRPPAEDWRFYGNIFGSVATEPTTWSKIKAEFGE